MLNDRNILRKVKTELERMIRPYSVKMRKVESEMRTMRTRFSRLNKEIQKLKEPEKS